MAYVVVHFLLARIFPQLQRGFLFLFQFLLLGVGAKPVVVRHLPGQAA